MLKIKALLQKLTENVQSLLNKTKTDSAWTTLTTAEGFGQYRIIRGLVVLDCSGLAPTTDWKTLATLPSNIRPPVNWRTQGYCGPSGKYPMTVLVQSSDGTMIISSSSAQSSGAFTIAYPLV